MFRVKYGNGPSGEFTTNRQEHTQGAGYGPMMHCDFYFFQQRLREHFDNPPARSCVVSSMVVDCKVEIECVAYKKPGA